MIKYTILTAEEMKELIYRNECLPVIKCENNSFKGFHYFDVSHFIGLYLPQGLVFIVAYIEELIAENIVGIVKVAEYKLGYDIRK